MTNYFYLLYTNRNASESCIIFSLNDLHWKEAHTEKRNQILLHVYIYSVGIMEVFDFNIARYWTYDIEQMQVSCEKS
jgi:hypothetical protein